MSSMSVLLAYPTGYSRAAMIIAARLRALGYDLDALRFGVHDRRCIPLQGHERVVVLWSRAAGRSALRELAIRAKALGKLALISVDGASAPISMGEAQRRPRGPQQAQSWRRIVEPNKEEIVTTDKSAKSGRASSRWHAVLAALALISVAASAAYVSNAAAAAQINAWVETLDATASAAVNGSSGGH